MCAGKDHALVCDANTWNAVPCKGPRGCARPETAGALEQCDDTLGAEGDPCPSSPALDYACSEDHAAALVCRDGRFALWRRCRGPRACVVGAAPGASDARAADAGAAQPANEADTRSVRCDTSAGAPGDPCERRGSYACSTDGKTMLVCTGASLAPASSCRGPNGCHVDTATSKVDCDDTVAEVGDPCDEARRITCAADHKAELVCVGVQAGADARVNASADAGADAGVDADAGAGACAAAPAGAPLGGQYAKKRECRRSDCSIAGSELFCD